MGEATPEARTKVALAARLAERPEPCMPRTTFPAEILNGRDDRLRPRRHPGRHRPGPGGLAEHHPRRGRPAAPAVRRRAQDGRARGQGPAGARLRRRRRAAGRRPGPGWSSASSPSIWAASPTRAPLPRRGRDPGRAARGRRETGGLHQQADPPVGRPARRPGPDAIFRRRGRGRQRPRRQARSAPRAGHDRGGRRRSRPAP
jgi:hypothetical protein